MGAWNGGGLGASAPPFCPAAHPQRVGSRVSEARTSPGTPLRPAPGHRGSPQPLPWPLARGWTLRAADLSLCPPAWSLPSGRERPQAGLHGNRRRRVVNPSPPSRSQGGIGCVNRQSRLGLFREGLPLLRGARWASRWTWTCFLHFFPSPQKRKAGAGLRRLSCSCFLS